MATGLPPRPTSAAQKQKAGTASKSALTPLRKHRKMLKDGSSEVWPEDVEKIFVQGLRQYWDSSWATYSRGRSRWRNQYLVDHLQKAGVSRTKKQVASHIQVLRNMWKGEPEYQLVAGGDESQDAEPTSPTNDDGTPNSGDDDDSSDFSFPGPSSPTGAVSPAPDDYLSVRGMSSLHVAATPGDDARAYASMTSVKCEDLTDYTTPNALQGLSPPTRPVMYSYPPPPPASYAIPNSGMAMAAHGTYPTNVLRSPPSSVMNPTTIKPDPGVADQRHLQRLQLPPLTTAFAPPRNRVTGLSFWATGMQALNIEVDRYTSGAPAPFVAFRVQLRLPAAPAPDLHGFQGAVSFASSWRSTATCETTVVASNAQVSKEIGQFAMITPGPEGSALDSGVSANVGAYLPDSWFTRCRYLNTTVPTTICQRISADGERLAYIIYDLERSSTLRVPSAEVTGFKKTFLTDVAHSTLSSHAAMPSPIAVGSHYFAPPPPMSLGKAATTSFPSQLRAGMP